MRQIISSPYPSQVGLIYLEITNGGDPDVGSITEQFQFEYRPNPTLEDITPRRTILRFE